MTEQSLHPNLELPDEWGLISGFVDDCELRGYSPETIRSHRSNLRTIARYLDSQGFGFRDVDKNVLKRVLTYLRNTRGVGQKTLKSYFSALSSFYEYLVYEDLHSVNPVPSFRKRYLKTYKKGQVASRRKLLSVEALSLLINSVLEIRDKAIMTVFAKTGIRRGELIGIDVDDIDWSENYIKLKKRRKRSNPYVFFDEEAAIILGRCARARARQRRLHISSFHRLVSSSRMHPLSGPSMHSRLKIHCIINMKVVRWLASAKLERTLCDSRRYAQGFTVIMDVEDRGRSWVPRNSKP